MDLLVLCIADKMIGDESLIGIGYYGSQMSSKVYTTRYGTVEDRGDTVIERLHK